jgi:hypothetical protein
MCSVAISSEGAIVSRPKPARMADKLRIITADVMLEFHKVKTQRLIDQLRWRATQAAKNGVFSISLWLSDLGITKESAELVSDELKREGFKCTISNEITAWHSNTDCDSDELLFISWE